MPEPIEVRIWLTPMPEVTYQSAVLASEVERVLKRELAVARVEAETVTPDCVACDETSVTVINGDPHCREHADRAEERARLRETECPCDGGTGALCAECRTIAARHGVL